MIPITVTSRCPHIEICSGCSEDPSLNPPPVWQEVLSFLSPHVVPSLHRDSPYHWRHRAKIAVRGTCDNPQIGLFVRNSHEVAPIPACLTHHPRLNEAFNIVRGWMVQNAIVPYQEGTGLGDVRYLQAVVHRETGRVQMTFVLNASNRPGKVMHWQRLVRQLTESHSNLWHSLWLNFNDRQTNTILGPHWSLIWGEEELWEKYGDTAVCYGPASFGQANLPLFEKMLAHLLSDLPARARVAEFYAGVGAIGLFLTPHCQWVRCTEINPCAESYFHLSRAKLHNSIASRLSFLTAPADKALSILDGANIVIADPPRKGLDQALLSALKENAHLQQLLYISCGWKSFKHDAQQLLDAGWKMQKVAGYLFFPGTNHVELLANFRRTAIY